MLDTELEVIAHLDDFEELPCESIVHASGMWGHSGYAAYWQQGPCACTTGYRCAGFFAVAMARGPERACGTCGTPTPPEAFTFTPISNN